MALSRRSFITAVGAGSVSAFTAPLIHARGLEASRGLAPVLQGIDERKADRRLAAQPGMIRIDSNENPVGPGEKALAAIRAALDASNRYPVLGEDDVKEAIAKIQGVPADLVMLGCGSGEILRSAVQAFTSKDRGYVAPAPTFEAPGNYAKFIGSPVVDVPVDAKLAADLDALASAARGAGLVYLCNPNNPTATAHTKADVTAFIKAVNAASPDTTILVDEAYFEYVDLPGYGTVIPLALQNPRVIVARTFSKVYGMAGLRLGYAIGTKETLAKMAGVQLGSNTNQLVLSAAAASLADPAHIAAEVKRNEEVRAFTRKFFAGLGLKMSAGQANFMMVDVGREAKAFKAACLAQKVAIGRPFPPLTNQARLSFGTMPEMQKAVEVFRAVLAQRP
ncbi:MAG TPA: aminotransferase class I/II-fold pyridoxal phosphate-dependent enzyme [Vicinamibacterales bacterium]|nr:aminotransferase class I/II-fold pyridoxal phosphate-dependent enzyme [Vicinamibacterales bacterium]